MKIPDAIASLPPEQHIPGVTVYWWTGLGWQAYRFIDYYLNGTAAKIAIGKAERIVKPSEIISAWASSRRAAQRIKKWPTKMAE